MIQSKRFGLISGLLVFMLLILQTFVIKLKQLFVFEIGAYAYILYLFVALSFIVFLYAVKPTSRKKSNMYYFVFLLVSIYFLNYALNWTFFSSPEEYESMYEWNAAKSLSWVISLPLILLTALVKGLLFDWVREKYLLVQ